MSLVVYLFVCLRSISKHVPFLFITGCSASTRIRSPEVFAPTIDRQQELNEVIHEQTSLIESLKADKTEIEKSLSSLKTDHERVTKENHILRRAVTIQEERRVNSEQEIKSVRAQNDERIRALEQIILSLRYHLQAQHDVGNDFMHPRPPDVF